MTEVGSFEAKTHFSDLLQRVERNGEKFIVTRRGKPVATLGPLETPRSTGDGLERLLDELSAFKAKIAGRGSVLKPGETWNEYAREGLE
jgi:prevent-host-death family protein